MMQESPFYEIIMQRGREQGREQGLEQGLEQVCARCPSKIYFLCLRNVFRRQDMQQVAEALEAILSVDRLIQLHTIALDTPSVERFLEV